MITTCVVEEAIPPILATDDGNVGQKMMAYERCDRIKREDSVEAASDMDFDQCNVDSSSVLTSTKTLEDRNRDSDSFFNKR